MVMALAAKTGRRSLDAIEDATNRRRTRQAMAFFLNKADWDAPEILRQKAMDTLKQLGWRQGETVYLILDDTQKKKRAKRMDAVSKIFLHAEKVYAHGHTILGCALVYRGAVIPYAVRLWANEDFCARTQRPSYPGQPVQFQKLTEMAASMVREATLSKATVLFDSYYLCPRVVQACKDRRYRYVGVAKKNRNFFPNGRQRDKRKLSSYGKNILDRAGRWLDVRGKKHRLAERIGCLSKAGRVKVVFSRRPGESSWIAMATNEIRWSAKTVLSHYLNRWPIEVLFKMSKQYLGLGDYQILRYRGIERYLHLVLIAHLLLTHLAIQEPGAQANIKGNDVFRLSSVPKLQQLLRNKLWDDVIDSMAKGSRNRRVGKKMKELLMF
jgi:SRSO17 transposase